MEQKFLICKHCGNIVAMVKEAGGTIVCCGEAMQPLVAGISDGAKEKHVPVYSVEGNKVLVKVGAICHPMTSAHYIEWISIQTKFGNQRKVLTPEQNCEAVFLIEEGDEIQAVYAYCNLHGLFKA